MPDSVIDYLPHRNVGRTRLQPQGVMDVPFKPQGAGMVSVTAHGAKKRQRLEIFKPGHEDPVASTEAGGPSISVEYRPRAGELALEGNWVARAVNLGEQMALTTVVVTSPSDFPIYLHRKPLAVFRLFETPLCWLRIVIAFPLGYVEIPETLANLPGVDLPLRTYFSVSPYVNDLTPLHRLVATVAWPIKSNLDFQCASLCSPTGNFPQGSLSHVYRFEEELAEIHLELQIDCWPDATIDLDLTDIKSTLDLALCVRDRRFAINADLSMVGFDFSFGSAEADQLTTVLGLKKLISDQVATTVLQYIRNQAYLQAYSSLIHNMLAPPAPSTGTAGVDDVKIIKHAFSGDSLDVQYCTYSTLVLYWHEGKSDNFTTATKGSATRAEMDGYRRVRVEGYAYTEPGPGRSPLYLYVNEATGHTCAITGDQPGLLGDGYVRRGTETYVMTAATPGAVPLKVFLHGSRNDYFTTATPQGEASALAAGYVLYREIGYVHPAEPY